jgi:hypothetical protein
VKWLRKIRKLCLSDIPNEFRTLSYSTLRLCLGACLDVMKNNPSFPIRVQFHEVRARIAALMAGISFRSNSFPCFFSASLHYDTSLSILFYTS